jgi:hypothetical protein
MVRFLLGANVSPWLDLTWRNAGYCTLLGFLVKYSHVADNGRHKDRNHPTAHGSYYTLTKRQRVKHLTPKFPLFYQISPPGQQNPLFGSPINPIGNPIKSLGFPIKSTGLPINPIGNPINSLGCPIRLIGHLIKLIGCPINSLGSPIKSIGYPINPLGHKSTTYKGQNDPNLHLYQEY